MNIRWRKRAGLLSAVGVILLLLVMGLQQVAAQDKSEYPGESPAAPVPGAAAAEDKPTASLGVDILSQYIWRGFALSRQSAVLQPSLTVGYKGFSVNVWGNFDTSENAPAFLTPRTGAKWNETDFTFGYSREIYKSDFIKALTLNLGGIYYAFDSALYPNGGDAFELYYGLAADFNLFKLAVMGNSEVMHYPGTWLTVGISRVFELPYYKSTLELGNNYIFLFSRDNGFYPNTPFSNPASTKAFSGPLAGQLYATLTIPINSTCLWPLRSASGMVWAGIPPSC